MRPFIVLAALLAAPFAVADDPPGYCATPPEEVGEHHFWYSYYHSPCIFVSSPLARCGCALNECRSHCDQRASDCDWTMWQLQQCKDACLEENVGGCPPGSPAHWRQFVDIPDDVAIFIGLPLLE